MYVSSNFLLILYSLEKHEIEFGKVSFLKQEHVTFLLNMTKEDKNKQNIWYAVCYVI